MLEILGLEGVWKGFGRVCVCICVCMCVCMCVCVCIYVCMCNLEVLHREKRSGGGL